jgi:acetyl-CoA carboxylase beta subunit
MSTKGSWAKRLAQRQEHEEAGTRPMSALDRCDRCGARAYVRAVSRRRQELLFCAHHYRQHAVALATFAVDIQDTTRQLARSEMARPA